MDYSKHIVDSSSDVVYLVEVTKDGRFIHKDINNAFVEATGLQRDTLIDHFVDELEDQEFQKILIDKYSSCVKARKKQIIYMSIIFLKEKNISLCNVTHT